jgi:hypothetical protein
MKPWNFSAFSLWRSNLTFSLSTFNTFRCWIIWRSVIRCWVPIRVGSDLAFGHSLFGHSVFGLSVLGHSMFGHSTFNVWFTYWTPKDWSWMTEHRMAQHQRPNPEWPNTEWLNIKLDPTPNRDPTSNDQGSRIFVSAPVHTWTLKKLP